MLTVGVHGGNDIVTVFACVSKAGQRSATSSGVKKFLYDRAVVDFSTKNVPVNVTVNTVEQEVLGIISQNSFEKV